MKKYKKYLLIMIFLSIIFVISNIIISAMNKNKNQQYPIKEIKLIVPYKKGGGTDITARYLAKIINEKYNVKVNIDYIKSEIGNRGYEKICDSENDGYTFGIINIPNFINTSIKNNYFYKERKLTPIMNFSYDPCVFVVNKKSKYKKIEDFIKDCKENPDKIRVSNNGVGSSNFIAGQDFFNKVDIEIVHVPFNGSGDMLRAVEKGYSDGAVAKLSEILDDKNKDKFKILTTFTSNKIDGLPNIDESGYEVFHGSYRAIVGPTDLSDFNSNRIYNMIYEASKTEYAKSEAKKDNINVDIKKTQELTNIMEDEEKRIREFIMETD